MIISKSVNIPSVSVLFSFGVESVQLTATGILDTGCNITQIPLGVLANTGISKDSINYEISKLKLLFASELVTPESSSGTLTPAIVTCIHNMIIETQDDTFELPSMYIRLALTAESRFVLLGHDFIMSHNELRNIDHKFAIDKFDHEYYKSLYSKNVIDINEIMSYLSI